MLDCWNPQMDLVYKERKIEQQLIEKKRIQQLKKIKEDQKIKELDDLENRIIISGEIEEKDKKIEEIAQQKNSFMVIQSKKGILKDKKNKNKIKKDNLVNNKSTVVGNLNIQNNLQIQEIEKKYSQKPSN